MALQQGTKTVNERSSTTIEATFLNESRVKSAPSSARYRIDDITDGRLQTILDWTTISTPASVQTISITAEQNRILNETNTMETRVVTVEGTGSNGPIREKFIYQIVNGPSRD